MFSTLAGLLGIISAVLGFIAEATKVQQSEVIIDTVTGLCVYPSSPAAALGIISALTSLAAFIVINSAGRCFCCYKSHQCQCNTPLVCFIFSWLTFLPGFLLLLLAAASSMSLNTIAMQDQYGRLYCKYMLPGYFASGACLSLISIALGITYYRILNHTSAQNVPPHHNADIAMGQPVQAYV